MTRAEAYMECVLAGVTIKPGRFWLSMMYEGRVLAQIQTTLDMARESNVYAPSGQGHPIPIATIRKATVFAQRLHRKRCIEQYGSVLAGF